MEQSPFLKSRPLRISPAGSPVVRRYQPVTMPLAGRLAEPRTILDFDIETRRVGFHTAGKFAPDGCEPIAIAWALPDDQPTVLTMDPRWSERTMVNMLERFREQWDDADMVTGHYVLRFDIPVINGAMLEFGLKPLAPKLVHDTKVHLFRRGAVSCSQENLAIMRKIEERKFGMADANWRNAARLTPAAMELTRERVVADVKQHWALRQSLVEDGYMRQPTVYRP